MTLRKKRKQVCACTELLLSIIDNTHTIIYIVINCFVSGISLYIYIYIVNNIVNGSDTYRNIINRKKWKQKFTLKPFIIQTYWRNNYTCLLCEIGTASQLYRSSFSCPLAFQITTIQNMYNPIMIFKSKLVYP